MNITEAIIKCISIAIVAPIVGWLLGEIKPFEMLNIRLNFNLRFIKNRLEDVFLTEELEKTLLEEHKRLVMQKITRFDNPVLQEAVLMISNKSPDIPSPIYLSKFRKLLIIDEHGILCFSQEKINEYLINFFVTYISGCAILSLGFYYGKEDDIFFKTCLALTVLIHCLSIRYATPGEKKRTEIEKRIKRAYNS